MNGDTLRLRWPHMVVGVGAAVAVGVVLVAGVGRLAGYADVRAAVRGASWGWLAFCAVGQVLVFAGYAGSMRRAVASEGGPRLPVGLSLRLVLAGFAATQVFAFAGVGGLVVTFWALRRLGRSREEAVVCLIGLSTAVYLVFAAVGWCAAGIALVLGDAPLGMTVPWIVGVPAVVALAAWFTAPPRVGRWATGRTRVGRALATGVAAAAWVRRAVLDPADRRLFGWAALYWVGDLVSLHFALRAFGAEVGLAALAAAYTTGYLVQSIPVPLIATGGVDAATTFLLHVVGVPLDLALVGVVAHRVFAFWLPVVPGAAMALLLPRTGSRLRALATVAAVSGAGTEPRSPGSDG